MKPRLSAGGVRLIEQSVAELFRKIREHTFGDRSPTGKNLYGRYRPDLTFQAIFNAGAAEEGVKPQSDIFKTLLKIADSYLDAAEAKAKAKAIQAVQSALVEAGNRKSRTSLSTVLGGKLYEIMGETASDVRRIMETESTTFRNISIMDGITRVNAAAGIEDPTVFWVPVRDESLCSECRRLHLQPDGITPRVWKMSEVKHGYAKRGDEFPSISEQHPNGRCVLSTLLPGYGFSPGGKVEYKNPGWDEFKHQRGL